MHFELGTMLIQFASIVILLGIVVLIVILMTFPFRKIFRNIARLETRMDELEEIIRNKLK
ncbi:hypothetical protein BHU72_01590 [Desulfuribacillus stibiiarsenatis]|uniref:DUF4083 domain-containing protein n=1 Tax=Desulfuribacillus stibiiarsenatis TaxID=1390249 RepID=A0A1E5LA20_9FIRM|nr:hypothetical protein BHU72_01590 [Desulfuribacillus stibiiarsenatis]